MPTQPFSPESFTTFGDLLKYLRRRERLTQLELSIQVGYSETQIGRLEKNQRRPDLTSLKALFIPALHLEGEPELTARLLELAETARLEVAPAPGIPPYKGLLYFDEMDADLFFGRESLIEHLVERVTALATGAFARFLAVVGASGSGKSSLMRAGLAVALKRAGWDTHIITPSAEPLKMLKKLLNSNDIQAEAEHVLILVDQFEETFTLCREENERAAFIEELLSLAISPLSQPEREVGSEGQITVVIALRADFYSHCAQYPSLRAAVAAEQEYIGQMTTADLRRAIEEPARRGSWEFEHGLVEVLIQDIGVHGSAQPEPGALPLLSHALLATWENRRGRTFTLDGYRASGGVRGAIAKTAESVFTDQLNQAQQEMAREVFLRLTELGEGTEYTRRRAALNELVSESSEANQLRTVLNTLADARLITLGEDSAEVAHEALIREWQRLHEWLMQDREGLRLHRHLTEATRDWEARGRDASELYRGARLAQAREWAGINEDRLNESERAFLNASIEQEHRDTFVREAQRQRELEAAQKLAESERYAARQLRRRALFLSAALVLAIVLAGVAILFSGQATENARTAQTEAKARATAEVQAIWERETAERQASLAISRELAAAAISNLNVDPERCILLALSALSIAYSQEAEDALHRAVFASRVKMTFRGHEGLVGVAVYSPDGSRIATAGEDGYVKVWDVESGENILTLSGHEGPIYEVIFSSSGQWIATAGEDGTARLWDSKTGEMIITLEGQQEAVVGLAFSPDEKWLATGGVDGSVILWDAGSGQQLKRLRAHDDVVLSIAFSPEGPQLVTSSYDNKLIFWDVIGGKKLRTWEGEFDNLVFSFDGQRLMANFSEGTKILDAATEENLVTIGGHTNLVLTAAIDPQWKRIASSGLDRKVVISDAETGRNLFTLPGHTGSILDVHFSPDGKQLATASVDGTARVWNVGPASEALVISNLDSSGRVAYSRDGALLVSVDSNEPALWEAVTGRKVRAFSGHTTGVSSAALSPDGLLLASASDDGSAKIWETATGRELFTLKSHSQLLNAIAFSPDGLRVATASEDGTAIVWDAHSGEELLTLIGHTEFLTTVAFSPDGQRLATGDTDGVAILWYAATGEALLNLEGHGDTVWGVAFSPDSRLVGTASRDGTAKIWDAETGEELLTLVGHTSTVVTIAFSPDGRRVATASRDGTAKLWDAETGALQLTLYGDGSGLNGVAFSPDGKHLATAGNEGIWIYLLKTEDLIELAKKRLTRALTVEECLTYLHLDRCPEFSNQ